jgi:hypothetical protein
MNRLEDCEPLLSGREASEIVDEDGTDAVVLDQEGNEILMWNPEEAVPTEFYDADLFNQCPEDWRGDDGYFSGQGLKVAWKAARFMVGVFVAVPVLSLGAMALSGSCPVHTFPQVPTWCYLAFALGTGRLMFYEEEVRKYSIIAQAKTLNTKMAFKKWIWYMRGLSVMAHADLFTTGMFLAKSWRADSCGIISRFWAKTMGHSILSGLIGAIPFSALALLGWLLMLPQGVYTYLATQPVPTKGFKFSVTFKPRQDIRSEESEDKIQTKLESECLKRGVNRAKAWENGIISWHDQHGAHLDGPQLEDYFFYKEDEGNRPTTKYKFQVMATVTINDDGVRPDEYDGFYDINFEEGGKWNYTTYLVVDQDHGGSLQTVAELTRMASVTEKYSEYATHDGEATWVAQEMFRCAIKFGVFNVLESAYQLNLQSSGLALAKAINAGQLDRQTAFSIMMSLTMAAKNLYSRYDYMKKASKAIDIFAEAHYGNPDYQHDISRANFDRSRAWYLFMSIATIYVLLISRALFQTCMAWYCPYGLHNIGVGCYKP